MRRLKPTWNSIFRLAGEAALVAAGPLVWAAEPTSAASAASASSLRPSADGLSVLDLREKQVWLRCVEGMRWDGKTCTGDPVLMTHSEAVAWAAAVAKAEGVNWRLPHVTELRRLAGSAAGRSALDPKIFPTAPVGWYWSRTASLNTAKVNQYDYANIARGRNNDNAVRLNYRQSWAVNMGTGEARGDVDRATKLSVRLVRQQP